MDKIPEGRHLAKVIDYGLGETKGGEPQVLVQFKLEGDGSEITWFGSLKEGRASEITIDALLVMGFSGGDLLTLEGGAGSGVLDEKKSVSITVEAEEYQGKTQHKVRWVNPADGGGTKRKLTDDKKAKLKSFKGLIAQRRAETGIKDPGPRDSELDF